MIQQVAHAEYGADPAGVALALAVARELRPPVPRAPEVATAKARPGRRTAARRRTVRADRG